MFIDEEKNQTSAELMITKQIYLKYFPEKKINNNNHDNNDNNKRSSVADNDKYK